MSAGERPALTYAVRELVWHMQSEIAIISCLARRIDNHVEALNAARRELAERLLALDALRGSAADPHLAAYLADSTQLRLPVVEEADAPRLDAQPP